MVTLHLDDGSTRHVLPAEEIRETLEGQSLWVHLVALGADCRAVILEGRDDGTTVWTTKVST